MKFSVRSSKSVIIPRSWRPFRDITKAEAVGDDSGNQCGARCDIETIVSSIFTTVCKVFLKGSPFIQITNSSHDARR